VSQLLDEARLARASLVLTADRGHRTAVAALYPDGASRSFTLLEFARLAPAAVRLGVMGPHDLVAAAAALRSQSAAGPPVQDDLADPIRGVAGDHEAMVALVQRAVAAIADALLPSTQPPIDVSPKGRRSLVR
jgi:protein-tyrosine phosphatase